MFTKLFSSITTSSIWNEDNNTRIVWITMLAMANKSGYVAASVGGLAHEARVDKSACESALRVLSSPDEDSRSKEFEGRRIEIVEGGFQLLNYDKYRAMRSEEERREYMRSYMKAYRETHNVNKNVNNVSECKPPLAKAEAEERRGDINTITKTESLYGFSTFWELYPKSVAKLTCLKVWKEFKFDKVTADRVLDGLRAQLTCREWREEGGKYVPKPENWLRGGCWEDKVSPSKPLVKDSGIFAQGGSK